jgi:hypothetical protein
MGRDRTEVAPTAGEIAELTAWLRQITTAGPGATPQTEIDAFLAAKYDLLNRITQGRRGRPQPEDKES